DLGGVLLDLVLDGRRGLHAADVDAVDVAGDRLGLGDLLRGDVDDGVGAGTDRAERGAGAIALELLVVHEEEQLVLDDRAAEGGAEGLLLLEAGEVGARDRVLAPPVAVAVGAVHRAVELVGARLGPRVPHRAGGTGDGGVVVGDVDVDRLDGVHRHRLAHGREVVRLQAEGVAGVDAVDADGVVARVLAADADLAARLVALGDARIQADVVLDVAVGRG